MGKQRRRVLVVGSPCGFTAAFKELAARGYQFEYVADTEAARTELLREMADVLVLRVPNDSDPQAALAWLKTIKGHLPVVVISAEDDVQLYLAAMEQGAFDYFTCHTPLQEIRRVLDNAIRWHQRQAA